jgi:putative membrane protein
LKALAILAALCGIGLATLLILSHGAARIWQSIATLGWSGFAVVVGFHLGLIALMGTAWWVLGRDRPGGAWRTFAWGRLIRDSASEALPLSQLGGFVIGARAVTLAGLSSGFAAASTVVDVTAELVAQLGYTAVGLVIFQALRPHNPYALPALVGLGVMTCLAATFIAIQARGAGLVERAGRRLAAQFLGARWGQSAAVQADIQRLHAERGKLLTSLVVHFTSWLLSGCETWLTLRLIAVPLSLGEALAIDSMLYGVRSAAFMVPNALGVQEGSLMVLGGLFGVGPDAALALSLIKRGRDLVIVIPSLLIWQVLEGRRAFAQLAADRSASG